MSAFDGLDDLDAWLSGCELLPQGSEPRDEGTAAVRLPEPATAAFGGSLFGADGGQSSGGGSSGGLRLAA